MPRIHKLPDALANLIAAGEVVERPGSVVKELVENSIDAGASRICVEIKNGGVSYIRVTDDGCGIEPHELETAFLRHATSKIQCEDDLNSILTLGFRGEALAAIAAVSRVDMLTRTRMHDWGAQITLIAGQLSQVQETGCPVGTTIVVGDLFANVPARAKFLKKDSTEAAYIEAVVTAAAIACPGVCFTLIKDGRECLFTPGDGKMPSAIYAACGRELASALLQTAGQFGNISVDGYISPPSLSRANRAMQFLFVNGRHIRSRALAAAVEQAYKARLPHSRHPAFFINVKMHASTVDANVHPAKLEVKFSHERDVFSAVYHSVQSALDGIDSLLPERTEKPPQEDNLTPNQQQITLTRSANAITFGESLAASHQKAASPGIDYRTTRDAPRPLPTAPPTAPVKPTQYLVPTLSPPQNPFDGSLKTVGQAFDTYVIAQRDDSLWLIDKHAAHERIIYNKLLENPGETAAQTLIEPIVAALSPQEKAACLENIESLARAGFEVEDFGAGAVIVRQIPAYLQAGDVAFVLQHMLEKQDGPGGINPVLHGILCGIACKSAVRAGDFTSSEEMERFAREVLAEGGVRNCPHGRPVLIKITRRELEKMFARTGL